MTGASKSKRTARKSANWLLVIVGILSIVLPVTMSYAVVESRLRWCPNDKDKTPADSIGKDGCSVHGIDQVSVVDDCRNTLTAKRIQDAQDYFTRAARWDHTRSLVTGSDPDSVLFQNMYAAVLYKLKNKVEAKQIAEAALGKTAAKEVGGASYTLGMLALEQGDSDEAEKLLRKHLETPNALFKQEVEGTLDTGIRVTLPGDAGEVALTIDGRKRTLSKEGFALALAGTHNVVLTSKRYKDFQQKVNVGYGEATLLNSKLQLRPITLNLICDSPANARFSLRPTGGGPSRNANGAFRSDVPEGQYLVHIEAPHYASQDVDISVRAGDPEIQKTFSLQRLAVFGIDTNGIPASFQLSDNSNVYRPVNQLVQDLKPGTYHVIVTPNDKKKYRPLPLDVEIAAGQRLIQPVTLKPAGGSIVLTVLNSTDYQVEVDGSRQKPNENLDLPAGEHTLILKARGYKDIAVPVTVQPGNSQNITRKFTEPHDRARAQSYVQEGIALLVHHQKTDAQKRAEDALGEDAVGPEAFGLLALISLPDKSETERWVNNALSRDKNDALALTARGSLFLNARQFDKARSDFELAVKANPDLALAHWLLGALYFQINKTMEKDGKKVDPKLYDMAEKQLETAVAEDKKFAEALLFLSKVYIARDNSGKAVDKLMQAVNNLPDPEPVVRDNPKGECYAYLALALNNQNKKQEAIPYLERASKLNFVGIGKNGHFDLYDVLKVTPPQ